MWTQIINFITGTKEGNDMQNNSRVKVLFVDMAPIGSLQIYGICTAEEANNNIDLTGRIYWSDAYSSNPVGPFKGVYEASQDFTRVLSLRKQHKNIVSEWNQNILYSNTPAFPEVLPMESFRPIYVKENITSMIDWKRSKGRKY